MPISQQQYALARLSSAAKAISNGSRNVDVISTLRDRTPIPQPVELDEGEAKWGKPSTFSWGSNARDFDQGIVPSTNWEVNWDDYPNQGDQPDDPTPPDDPALEPLTDEWTETDRKETVVRIDGPDGAYVDFARIDEVTFQLPPLQDGRQHFVVMKFKTDDSGVQPPNSGSGGSGASGAVGVGSDGVIRDPNGPGTL